MAKGVKKIKKLSNSSISGDYYKSGDVICVNPNQEASFVVGEWFNETTEEERRNINWLWMDHNKIKSFKETRKPTGEPYGLTFPKKLCGKYAYYLETSLSGEHDPRNTGIYVFGKCEKKITSASWSKKQNTADNSEINYGQDLFITLETEGLNGDTLKLELYSQKESKLIDTIKGNCTDGIFKGKFKTISYRKFPGLPGVVEHFYVKVINIENEYIKSASGSDKILSFKIIKNNSIITIPVFEAPTNTAPLTVAEIPAVEVVRTEGIFATYFAKQEFSLETAETAGQHTYIFKNPYSSINKDVIAPIIKKRVDAEVKADKKYAKLDDIKNALTTGPYAIGDPVSFNLCKLGANYIKINNAPLEEEVYVVAKTFLLDGKEVSITIKEKEAIVVDADAAVTVLEAKENGEELTILKATVENGIAKVKVKLRPKADEDLKIWKEKLLKGKKEESYTYTFKSEETTITDTNKKQFAAIILKNAKEGKQGNTKIATGKTAFVDDVEKALENKTYKGGDPITFDTYKTQTESLWLKAECQGDTVKHEKEFLKRDGEYFVIGKKCECEARVRAFMRMLRVGEGTGELIKSYDYNKKEIIYIAHDFQKAYTTAYNNHQITDLSTHPQLIYDGDSSAAGAYQVMRYVWWEISGFEVVNKRKTGKYIEDFDILKKHNISNYNAESQDKICLLIIKKQRPNLLEKIIKNDIQKAIQEDGCFIWASLPEDETHSHYKLNGELQSATPIIDCLEHYNKFLKEELADKSPLHLKKGFLQELGYNCCRESEKQGQICSVCNENHYDIAKSENWIHQKPSECWQASIDILAKYGLKNNSGYPQNRIIMATQENTSLIAKDTQKGLDYLDSQLKLGNPIVVGLDDNLRKSTYNSHKATEHFFVIVGKGCEKGQVYYRFFDVGSEALEEGTAEKNKLYLLDNKLLSGKSFGGTHNYTVTEIRRNY
ncbi:lysozyme family protein [Flavobacterium chungangense]|uniref:Uncharacterized protein n=1 Tax=Flavobacterium chungangense TaxID=554283 RepID=A0A6V6ZF49_9FLAO|nr:hypothetical protein [Flavobacterium chungangense]CAD0009512.1 hypothetical protein FLACHUCJ7_04271 [Flavobacterium chungangense]